MNSELEICRSKILLNSYMHERMISVHELAEDMFYTITINDHDDIFKSFYRNDNGTPHLIKRFHVSEKDGEQVTHCRNCAWFDGEFCRHYHFVKAQSDGKFKVWDLMRSEDDFCSDGEEGEYELWGFED